MKPVTKRILTISASLAGIGIAMMGVGLLLGGRPGVVFNNSGIISPYQKKVFYDQNIHKSIFKYFKINKKGNINN